MGGAGSIPVVRVILEDFSGPFWGGVTVVEVVAPLGGLAVLHASEGDVVLVGCRGHVFPPLGSECGQAYSPGILRVTGGVAVLAQDPPP
jgi:hypothetical protein